MKIEIIVPVHDTLPLSMVNTRLLYLDYWLIEPFLYKILHQRHHHESLSLPICLKYHESLFEIFALNLNKCLNVSHYPLLLYNKCTLLHLERDISPFTGCRLDPL